MKIVDIVRPEMIVSDMAARTKVDAVAELARHMAQHHPEIQAEALFKVLMDRESLASTAIGEEVAIPHAKLDTVSKLVACVGRSVSGVDFDSLDGRPTHIFFVLVAPENSTGLHLKALARISRLFKDPEFRSRLVGAGGAQDVYGVIAEEDSKY